MACLRNLSDECAPNLPPHIDVDQLSSPELKGVVVRAVQAHDRWDTQYPKAHREAIVTLQNPGGRLGKPGEDSYVMLVPGSEYVLVLWSGGSLQCYHVSTSECAWEIPPRPAGLKSEIFDVDVVVVEGSKQLMVLVLFKNTVTKTRSVFSLPFVRGYAHRI